MKRCELFILAAFLLSMPMARGADVLALPELSLLVKTLLAQFRDGCENRGATSGSSDGISG